MSHPKEALSELAEVRAAFDAAYEEYKHKVPTKICGPNLVGILNSAGFYKKEPEMSRDKDYADYCEKAGIDNRNRPETTFSPPTPSEYEKNRAAYIEYLLMCVRLGDWHGVSDAANDLRVLEAKQ